VADEPTSSASIHWPLIAHLSRPETWATDCARRAKGRVPTDVPLQTQPELALALVEQERTWGVPFATVVTDAGYGDNPTFWPGLDARHVTYVVGVSSTCGERLPDEVWATTLRSPPRPRGRGPPRSMRPRPCGMPCRRTAGSPSPGASTTTWSCANSWWPCGCIGRRGAPSAPPALPASARARRASGSASVRCRANAARSSGITVTCPRTRRCNGWSSWPIAAGPSSRSMKTPRARVAGTTSKAGAGMVCIGTARWSCWPTVFWRASAGRPPIRRAFPPAGERPAFPAVHRQVLVGLFQDVV
jgi:hypothetical protein